MSRAKCGWCESNNLNFGPENRGGEGRTRVRVEPPRLSRDLGVFCQPLDPTDAGMAPGEASPAVVVALAERSCSSRGWVRVWCSRCGAPGVFSVPWLHPRARDGKVGMVLEGRDELSVVWCSGNHGNTCKVLLTGSLARRLRICGCWEALGLWICDAAASSSAGKDSSGWERHWDPVFVGDGRSVGCVDLARQLQRLPLPSPRPFRSGASTEHGSLEARLVSIPGKQQRWELQLGAPCSTASGSALPEQHLPHIKRSDARNWPWHGGNSLNLHLGLDLSLPGSN